MEYSNRYKSARNEIYAWYNPYIEGLSKFEASIWHFQAIVCSIFMPPTTFPVIFSVLREPKHVKLLVIECFNWAKSARNELYEQYNPYIEGLNRFEASTWHFQAIVCSIFMPLTTYLKCRFSTMFTGHGTWYRIGYRGWYSTSLLYPLVL